MSESSAPEPLDFYTRVSLLDSLKGDQVPSGDVADVLAKILADERYGQYFFRDLANPAWLQPLRERGVFAHPPEPIKEKEGWRLPQWPAAGYLRRVAREKPGEVVDIALGWNTENSRTYMEILEAATDMPVREAARLVPAVIRWLDVPFDILLPERASKLLTYLAKKDRWRPALELLAALLEPAVPRTATGPSSPYFVPEAQSRRDRSQVEEILERSVPELTDFNPTGVTGVIEATLRKALRLEAQHRPGGSRFRGYSLIWRPAIEEHPQNQYGSYKGLLVRALRDAITTWAEVDPSSARRRLQRYLRSRYSILRRIALHTLHSQLQLFEDLARETLVSPAFDDDTECHHELYLLRARGFGILEPQER